MSALLGVSALLGGLHPACERFADCRAARTCSGEGGAAGAASGGSESGGGLPNEERSGSGGSGVASAGGGATGAGGLGGEGGASPVECGDATCTEALPYCDVLTDTCVECLNDQYCAASFGEGGCKLSTHTCVECIEASDCRSPTASVCADDACEECRQDEQCTHLTATPTCDAENGACVECTPDNESACDGHSCDPATLACTTTQLGSRSACQPCQADSECFEDYRCIPMLFDGEPRTGGYCLKRLATGCERPFAVPLEGRASLSGAAAATYCGVSEARTTCEAVLDLLTHDKPCTLAEDCGVAGLDDARCETVNLAANRCTYGCEATSECTSIHTCGPTGAGYCGYVAP